MKTRTVFQCKVTTHEGRVFENPLLPFEFHIIKTLLKENESVLVTREKWNEREIKQTFNI